jgi:hypothetical protein
MPADAVAGRDAELREAFEAGRIPPGGFPHRDHVRLAWGYLRERPLLEVLAVVPAGLRRLAAAAGRPERYHETITWAYLLLVRERLERGGGAGGDDWETFAAANPDLLAWGEGGAVARAYRKETLASDLARRAFVWPDAAR